MFQVLQAPYRILVQESCGIAHTAQVLAVAAPPGDAAVLVLEDSATGQRLCMQRSAQDSGMCFLFLDIAPFARRELRPVDGAADGPAAVTVADDVVSNGLLALRVPVGEAPGGDDTPGPVVQVRVGEGAWRGRTFFDTRAPILSRHGEFVEHGPLRVVFRYRVALAGGQAYAAEVTLDAGQPFARISEEFSAGAGDQLVWDFAGADLPDTLYALDSTAGYTVRPLHYHLDQRMARLFAWTQYQQLFDLSDGYAVRMADSDDVVGVVALTGGAWRGNRLNHLEAWMRRWVGDDPASRRGVPAEAKADTFPGPEQIPARGVSRCTAHFNFEGWIGHGARHFALVATTLDRLLPAEQCDTHEDPKGCSVALGHFEMQPDRPRYRAQQGLLRRIHVQQGMFGLAEQAEMTFAWAPEEAKATFGYPHGVFRMELRPGSEAELTQKMLDYLQARVYGFWEGSGAAYSNCVVSRAVAPYMFYFEWLQRQGAFSTEQTALCRAHFSFLMHLFASDNYYPGLSTMTPVESDDSVEPTLEGMANQNFYTDVINVFGVGAQVFFRHPAGAAWREKFLAMWHRQLAYHVYPESGVWEESHTYYQHVLITVLPVLLRLQADGLTDEFANPAVQRLVGAALAQLTPRDAAYGGIRYLLPFGDHAVGVLGTRYLYREYAEAFAPHAPTLAAHLAWAYREMGGEEPLTVTPAPLPWGSGYVQGLGYFFRNVDARGVESLLALRGGSAWAHHHNDDGSLLFYAHGRSVLVEAAFSEAPEEYAKKVNPAGHNRWTLRDYEPISYLWRFNRGWITRHDAAGRFPYAQAYTPVFMVATGPQQAIPLAQPVAHTRTVVQLSATAFLVVDAGATALPQVVRFHVPGEEVTVDGGAVAAIGDTCRLALLPLGDYPCRTAIERHASGKEEWITTEITFDIGTPPRAAFLLSADAPDTTARVTPDGDGWQVVADGVDLRVTFVGAGIVLTDATGETWTVG